MEISNKILEMLQSLGIDSALIKLDHPKDEKFGDYTTNVAMILAKKEGKNPHEIAQDLKNKIKADDLIEKVEVVGGYLNFFIKPEYLKKQAEKINFEIEFQNSLSHHGKNKTLVIDYSAPNIAKPFGIGHLRSTNIGQAIYNIYKILGWTCIGDNHLGDWGTQFGKLTCAILNPDWNDKKPEDLSIDDLEKLYVRFHKESESDPTLVDRGREWFSKLENGDKQAREIWQKCIDISQREFDRVYELLNVKIDFAYGESFYEDKMAMVLKVMDQKKILKKSEGAMIVEFDNMPPAIATKTNGATTYLTRDLATIKYRVDTWNPDLIIYEVGSDQNLYFQQLFATAKMIGYDVEMVHIGHGLLRWKDGKFSTRKGDTIHLSEVIETAMEQAKKIAPNNTHEEIETVAIGAIKFNDLAQDPKKDIIFEWDRVMSMDGNSGPYLQYTYARCQSVLNKTEIKESPKGTRFTAHKDIANLPSNINVEEMALLREFYKFEEKIVEAAERYNPAVVAEYLLGVARKYNEFYAKHRIIGEAEETWRIFLTKTTASTIKTGLNLLGIKTLEKM